jgi:N-acetylmuramate 1-kinase
MDAPTDTEDCRPFVDIASRLAECNICVPQILVQDLERGFLLLSDLGDQTYLDVINAENADELYRDAISALVRFQKSANTTELPQYDAALLRREMELFPEWYLQAHLGLQVDASLRGLLDRLFNTLIEQVLSQSSVFVHRDYMPRNLMVNTPNPAVIDFQDAVFGPISYDPICLFKDAFLSWPEQKVQQWLEQYWLQARSESLPVPDTFAQFQVDCDFMGVQRHLKVIGIFARICHRDGKSRYVADVPRFFDYLKVVAARRPELSLLSQLLSEVASRSGQSS